jgi:hypothetical protein
MSAQKRNHVSPARSVKAESTCVSSKLPAAGVQPWLLSSKTACVGFMQAGVDGADEDMQMVEADWMGQIR